MSDGPVSLRLKVGRRNILFRNCDAANRSWRKEGKANICPIDLESSSNMFLNLHKSFSGTDTTFPKSTQWFLHP